MAGFTGNIGPALAMARRQRGLSQGELAERCGMGRAQLSRYEVGKVRIRLDRLEKVLDVLGMLPDDFFRLVGSLEHAPALAHARPGFVDEHVVAEAFLKLHETIDELRAVVERAIDPAARFAKLIEEAAASPVSAEAGRGARAPRAGTADNGARAVALDKS